MAMMNLLNPPETGEPPPPPPSDDHPARDSNVNASNPGARPRRYRFTEDSDARLLQYVLPRIEQRSPTLSPTRPLLYRLVVQYQPTEATYGTRAQCWTQIVSDLKSSLALDSDLTPRSCRDRLKILLSRRPRRRNGTYETPAQETIVACVDEIKRRVVAAANPLEEGQSGGSSSSDEGCSGGSLPPKNPPVRLPSLRTHIAASCSRYTTSEPPQESARPPVRLGYPQDTYSSGGGSAVRSKVRPRSSGMSNYPVTNPHHQQNNNSSSSSSLGPRPPPNASGPVPGSSSSGSSHSFSTDSDNSSNDSSAKRQKHSSSCVTTTTRTTDEAENKKTLQIQVHSLAENVRLIHGLINELLEMERSHQRVQEGRR